MDDLIKIVTATGRRCIRARSTYLTGNIWTLVAGAGVALTLAACTTKSMLVYSSGFNFTNYEYVVVGKPDGRGTSTMLYGMDVELANLLARYNMKVIGNKEAETLSPGDKSKTVFARMSMEMDSNNHIILSVSFDEMVTGRTGASITTYTKGKIWDTRSRTEAFADTAQAIAHAFQHDKDLTVTQTIAKRQ